jgi:hypothetical protein
MIRYAMLSTTSVVASDSRATTANLLRCLPNLVRSQLAAGAIPGPAGPYPDEAE